MKIHLSIIAVGIIGSCVCAMNTPMIRDLASGWFIGFDPSARFIYRVDTGAMASLFGMGVTVSYALAFAWSAMVKGKDD